MRAIKRKTLTILSLFLFISIFSGNPVAFAKSNKEQLIDNYGGLNADPWLCGWLGISQPSRNSSTSAHGSDFYVTASCSLSKITLVVARDSCLYSHTPTTNGWTNTPTVNVTLNIYALSNQSYAGLPVGAPLVVSNPINSSTLTSVNMQTLNATPADANTPLQNVTSYYQNFTFSSLHVLNSNTYYGMVLQAGNVGIINETRRVWLYFFNTSTSGRTVFLYQNNAWGYDYRAVDCTVTMQILGYAYPMIATITPLAPLIVIIGVVILAVAVHLIRKRKRTGKTSLKPIQQ